MIYQFHHQFEDGHTEMKSQSDDLPGRVSEREWVQEQVRLFPPPEGAINMVCNEKSLFFVWTTTREEIKMAY